MCCLGITGKKGMAYAFAIWQKFSGLSGHSSLVAYIGLVVVVVGSFFVFFFLARWKKVVGSRPCSTEHQKRAGSWPRTKPASTCTPCRHGRRTTPLRFRTGIHYALLRRDRSGAKPKCSDALLALRPADISNRIFFH